MQEVELPMPFYTLDGKKRFFQIVRGCCTRPTSTQQQANTLAASIQQALDRGLPLPEDATAPLLDPILLEPGQTGWVMDENDASGTAICVVSDPFSNVSCHKLDRNTNQLGAPFAPEDDQTLDEPYRYGG